MSRASPGGPGTRGPDEPVDSIGSAEGATPTRRVAVDIEGVVQGVGFRPFVYRAARERNLVGWVANGSDGVHIEAEGFDADVATFLDVLRREAPPRSRVERVSVRDLDPCGEESFAIVASSSTRDKRPTVPADLALCAECAREIEDPSARRHDYAFTNCTNCGPRFSIVESLPYDRPNTSMRAFAMCPACSREYGDPLDRRFHAQPIACPACGPRIALVSPSGECLAVGESTLDEAARRVRAGGVLALKGLGGFQLLVDATDARAVQTLRDRKHREAKPFAVMFPDLASLRAACELDPSEEEALGSPEAPIVLVRRRSAAEGAFVAEGVAPGNPRLGALLPYTPLHRLFASRVGRPVVCTSGNVSEEPMCIDNEEALARLGRIADVFLLHDRPIVRPVDDSVVRVDARGPMLLRRARGYAPLPLAIRPTARPILALGAEQKGTVGLALGDRAIVSQHLGDVSSLAGARRCSQAVEDLLQFYEAVPGVIACDRHPDYLSTRIAERLASRFGARLVRVQHHHAHIAACISEHGLSGPVLGFAWDGSGLGDDTTLWGGEALLCEGGSFRRVSHLRTFSLPGGEAAAREPRRTALSLLVASGELARAPRVCEAFAAHEAAALTALVQRGAAPRTSSMGRLFDAVAALTGLMAVSRFEGDAAMRLEHAAAPLEDEGYELPLWSRGSLWIADWEPLVAEILEDLGRGTPVPVVSARFHNGLAELARATAERIEVERIVLSGGCFQNARLTEAVSRRLGAAGFDVYVPRAFPPNDGGISLGQLFVAAHDGGPPATPA